MSASILAAFIDYENVPCRDPEGLGRLLSRLRDHGQLRVVRAYADWSRQPRAAEVAALGIELVMAAATPTGKNAADIRLVMDALELALTTPEIGTFVIASGDSDVAPLLHRLRGLGRRVVVVARRTSMSAGLQAIADDTLFCDQLETESSPIGPLEAAFAAVDRILGQTGRPQDPPSLVRVLKAELPGFDYKALGFSKFLAFMEAAERAGVCRLQPQAGAGFLATQGRTPPRSAGMR